MPAITEIQSVKPELINEDSSFASFRDNEIGVIFNKKDGSKTTVSITGNNGSKTIFIGGKQMSTCRNNDDPLPIIHAHAKRKGCKFHPKNTGRKECTKKPIKRRHGKNGHIINRFYSGHEF